MSDMLDNALSSRQRAGIELEFKGGRYTEGNYLGGCSTVCYCPADESEATSCDNGHPVGAQEMPQSTWAGMYCTWSPRSMYHIQGSPTGRGRTAPASASARDGQGTWVMDWGVRRVLNWVWTCVCGCVRYIMTPALRCPGLPCPQSSPSFPLASWTRQDKANRTFCPPFLSNSNLDWPSGGIPTQPIQP